MLIAGHGTGVLLANVFVLPQPDPSCPAIASASDIVSQIPIIGGIASLIAALTQMVTSILSWIGNPGQMAHDIGGWTIFHLIGYNPDAPQCYRPTSAYGFARSVLMGDVSLSGSSIYKDAYSVLADASLVAVMLAAMVRAARLSAARELPPGQILADSVARVVLGIAGIECGFAVLEWLLPLCSDVGQGLFGALTSLTGGIQGGADALGMILFSALDGIFPLGLLAVVLLPVLLILLIRVLALLVARFLVVSFCVAFTPLVIAVAVADHRAPVVRWWAGMMGGAAITPIVVAGCLGITLGLATRFTQGDGTPASFSVGPLVGAIITLGGLWLTGKAIRALLFTGTGERPAGVMSFLRQSTEMAVSGVVAAAGVMTGNPVAALGAVSGRAGQAARALQRSGGAVRAASRPGVSALVGTSVPVSPSAAMASFRSVPAGQALAEAATPHMGTGVSAGARWAFLEQQPEMEAPMRELRDSLWAGLARTGRLGVDDEQQGRFLSAARSVSARAVSDEA